MLLNAGAGIYFDVLILISYWKKIKKNRSWTRTLLRSRSIKSGASKWVVRVAASQKPSRSSPATRRTFSKPKMVKMPKSGSSACRLRWRRRTLATLPQADPFHSIFPSLNRSLVCELPFETRYYLLNTYFVFFFFLFYPIWLAWSNPLLPLFWRLNALKTSN